MTYSGRWLWVGIERSMENFNELESSKMEDMKLVKEKFNDFVDGVSQKIGLAKDKVNDFANNGKSKVEEFKVN